MSAINIKTSGMHHVAFRSANLSRAKKFYVDTLGFPLLLENPELIIVGIGNFALAIKGPDAGTPKGDSFNPFRVGLDHIALASADLSEIERVAGLLKENGIWSEGPKVDPTLGKTYVAFKDPDGIKLELYQA
ncbi:MAG: VOC family protein [Bacteroidota bacterium]